MHTSLQWKLSTACAHSGRLLCVRMLHSNFCFSTLMPVALCTLSSSAARNGTSPCPDPDRLATSIESGFKPHQCPESESLCRLPWRSEQRRPRTALYQRCKTHLHQHVQSSASVARGQRQQRQIAIWCACHRPQILKKFLVSHRLWLSKKLSHAPTVPLVVHLQRRSFQRRR